MTSPKLTYTQHTLLCRDVYDFNYIANAAVLLFQQFYYMNKLKSSDLLHRHI